MMPHRRPLSALGVIVCQHNRNGETALAEGERSGPESRIHFHLIALPMATDFPSSKSATTGIKRPQLPVDQRVRLGGWLFLLSLLIFFLSSILLYGLYAYSRRDDLRSLEPLPGAYLISTGCILAISGLVHFATRSVRRDRFRTTSWLLGISSLAAVVFTAIQCYAMIKTLLGPALYEGTGRGVAGMVVVLAILHALHVLGGIVALGIVSVRAAAGRYDHERHWPVDFAAHYWHFLDLVWLCMLLAFWLTTGGFEF
jgi:cytochrome c oxidase subunit 3